MKQIAIVSGKGGTGKTVIASALSGLAGKSAVMVDCDVDAPDLHLILTPKIIEEKEFYAGKVASIDADKCTKCGKCLEKCRFDAISEDFVIDPISCEGCGVCYRICPAGAVKLTEKLSGRYFLSDTRFGPMVHAMLGIAEENSGKLVSLVRRRAVEIAKEKKLEYVLIDGPPGIGCPVIAAITGVDLVLVVTEPTLSGIHDLERIVELARKFKIKTNVCINKYDINFENSKAIEEYCNDKKINVIGKMYYNNEVTKAMMNRKTILEYSPGSEISREIKNVWNKIAGKKVK